MENTEPATVTPQEVRDLLCASRQGEAVIIDMGDGMTGVGPAVLAHPQARVLVRSTELRDLLATVTKHTDRLFVDDYRMTFDGYVLAALAINRRCSEVVNGRPVTIIRAVQ